ncbi:MAG: serine/threonine protein kinase [Chlamydiales bacterium]
MIIFILEEINMTVDLLAPLQEMKLSDSWSSHINRTPFRRPDFDKKVRDVAEEILHKFPIEGGSCSRRDSEYSLKDFTEINTARATLTNLQRDYHSRKDTRPIYSYYNLDLLTKKIDDLKKEVLLKLPQAGQKTFPDMIGIEDLARDMAREIAEIHFDCEHDSEDYLRYAEGLLNVARNLAQNPHDTQAIRLSKTHDHFRIDDRFPQAHLIRSCWMWMSEDANFVELQMIHSAKEEKNDFRSGKWSMVDHAILGTGSYKKVKRSTHFSIALRPAIGEAKVKLTKTALVRGITADPDISGDHVYRRRLDKSLFWDREMRMITDDIDDLDKKIQKVAVFFSTIGLPAKLAWGALRHNDFHVSKTMGRGTAYESQAVQKKLEREEERYDGDLCALREKMSLRGKMTAILDIGGTLTELHRRGIVHCDVKNRNVLGRYQNPDLVDAYLADFDLTMKEGRMEEDFGTYEYWDSSANSGVATKSTDVYGFAILIGELIFSTPFYHFRADPTLVFSERYDDLLNNELRTITAMLMNDLDYQKEERIGPIAPEARIDSEKFLRELLFDHRVSEADKSLVRQGLKEIKLLKEVHEFIQGIVRSDTALFEGLSKDEELEVEACVCSPSFRRKREEPKEGLTLIEKLRSEDLVVFQNGINQVNAFYPSMQQCHGEILAMTNRFLA